jgi:hypothetical protein
MWGGVPQHFLNGSKPDGSSGEGPSMKESCSQRVCSWWAMLVGLMLTILLSPVLGVAITRSVHPLLWWCGVALIAWGLTSGFSALSVDLAAPWLRAILVGAPLTLVGYAIYRAGARLDEQLSQVR